MRRDHGDRSSTARALRRSNQISPIKESDQYLEWQAQNLSSLKPWTTAHLFTDPWRQTQFSSAASRPQHRNLMLAMEIKQPKLMFACRLQATYTMSRTQGALTPKIAEHKPKNAGRLECSRHDVRFRGQTSTRAEFPCLRIRQGQRRRISSEEGSGPARGTGRSHR